MPETTRPPITERSDRWIFPVAGQLVTQLTYDYAFVFLIGELEPHFRFTVEEPFTVRWRPDPILRFDPATDPVDMAATLTLLRRRVERAHAFKDGRLEVDFDGGILLRVPAGNGYEPWHVDGPDRYLMVSGPGGDLVIWH
jgi:Family of unknown function (DUF6188)